MGSFGERLQRERELRGISLEEIAEATKIGTRSLRALEEQDFDQLPGGIFNKGFVRAYARYLGLDEEQAVADYLAALSEAIAAGKVTRQESTANTTTPERNLLNQVEEREPLRLPVGVIVLVVVIAALLFGGWKYYAKYGLPKLRHVRAAGQQPPKAKVNPAPQTAPQAAPQTPPPIETPASAPIAVEPATVKAAVVKPAVIKPAVIKPATVQPAAAKPVAAADGFVVRIKAKESSWVSIIADGKLIMEGTLPLGAEKSIRAQHSVLLKAGDAAAIELLHNDQPVPPLGGAGEVKTVEFTAAGVRQ